ncbi:MAG: ANTAR domain-containing protein [Lachnospiraceae bacterium]|nr:ANTAR domain-containing protein [Lachnospiraceae bacterium]
MKQTNASCGIVAAAGTEEMMQSILLVLRDVQRSAASTGFSLRITKAYTPAEIRQALSPAGAAPPPGILLCSLTGKGSMSIDDLLMLSGRNPHLQIILLTGKDAREQIAFRCRKYPVYVFSLPLRRQILEEMLRMNLFMSGRILEKESELQRMRKKLNEVGIVTKAKCLLIQMRQMTEEEAHYYLEKRAMDEGLTKKEVAAAVIRLYS